jgi:hypothetical protein
MIQRVKLAKDVSFVCVESRNGPEETNASEANLWKHLNWVAEKLQICKPTDWYQVTQKQLMNLGSLILDKHCNSISNILEKAYPNYNWKPWKFVSIPSGYWNSLDNRIRYVEWVASKLKVNEPV